MLHGIKNCCHSIMLNCVFHFHIITVCQLECIGLTEMLFVCSHTLNTDEHITLGDSVQNYAMT